MGKREEIAVLFPGTLREFIESCSLDFESMREIRLRAGRPVLLMYGNREYGFTEKGEPVELEPDNQKGLFTLTERQIRETAEIMGGFSLYAAQEELRQGFFTVRGGHRIGVAGRTVLNQREVGVLKSISSLNVRSHSKIIMGDSLKAGPQFRALIHHADCDSKEPGDDDADPLHGSGSNSSG